MKKYRDEDWLKKQYGEREQSLKEIAKKCEIGKTTIWNWIHEFEIEKKTKEDIAKENPLSWSKNIAYLSGLITSDGSLRKDRPEVTFTSKDYSLVTQVKEIAEDSLNISNCTPFQINNGAWRYQFTSRCFYYFLEKMELIPDKSHKLEILNIPKNMFLDWLRGEIDGDGCFDIDPRDNYLRMSIYSSSFTFLKWISQELKKRNLVNGKGNVNKSECYELRFYDQDSKSIARAIYDNADYYLQRKYDIAKKFI